MTYLRLKNIRYRYNIFPIVILIILVICIFLSTYIEVYNTYTTYGIYVDDYLYVDVDLNNSDAVNKSVFIKIDNQKMTFKIMEISKLQILENTNFNTYKIGIDEKYLNNQLIKITFYYKKERIIKKIISYIF